MIQALVVALSLPGLALAWGLLRRERSARLLPANEVVEARFGFDSSGLV